MSTMIDAAIELAAQEIDEMSEDDAEVPNRIREAWAALGDEFADIGHRFRENYDHVSAAATSGNERSEESINRAVTTIRKAVKDTARAIGESLRDPQIREETEEAGSALLRAVGVTLSEWGQTLQSDADRERREAQGGGR